MICKNCGTDNPDDAFRCKRCQALLELQREPKPQPAAPQKEQTDGATEGPTEPVRKRKFPTLRLFIAVVLTIGVGIATYSIFRWYNVDRHVAEAKELIARKEWREAYVNLQKISPPYTEDVATFRQLASDHIDLETVRRHATQGNWSTCWEILKIIPPQSPIQSDVDELKRVVGAKIGPYYVQMFRTVMKEQGPNLAYSTIVSGYFTIRSSGSADVVWSLIDSLLKSFIVGQWTRNDGFPYNRFSSAMEVFTFNRNRTFQYELLGWVLNKELFQNVSGQYSFRVEGNRFYLAAFPERVWGTTSTVPEVFAFDFEFTSNSLFARRDEPTRFKRKGE